MTPVFQGLARMAFTAVLAGLVGWGTPVYGGPVSGKDFENPPPENRGEFLDGSAIELLIGNSVPSPRLLPREETTASPQFNSDLSSLFEGLEEGMPQAGIPWTDPEDPSEATEFPLQGNEFLDTFEEDLDPNASGTTTIDVTEPDDDSR